MPITNRLHAKNGGKWQTLFDNMAECGLPEVRTRLIKLPYIAGEVRKVIIWWIFLKMQFLRLKDDLL